MQDVRLSYEDVGIYLIVFNVLLGLLFGFFPLLAGTVLKVKKMGILGFIASVLGGALAGFFLAFPAAFIFTWIILKKSRPASGDAVDTFRSSDGDHTT